MSKKNAERLTKLRRAYMFMDDKRNKHKVNDFCRFLTDYIGELTTPYNDKTLDKIYNDCIAAAEKHYPEFAYLIK